MSMKKRFGIVAACLLGYSSQLLADWQMNLSPGVTQVSQDIYSLHNTIMWICVAIGVVVFGVMFFSLFKYRHSKGATPAKFHDSTIVEVIWTIVPFLILIAMAVPATKTLVMMHDSEKADIDIKITGYQWKWKYDYLQEDVSFFSELHSDSRQAINGGDKPENYLLEVDNPVVVPVGKKIRFLVTASDVLHSWYVPALGVKKDAIPGFINETWAKIDKPGVYRGQCTELCGKDHGFMPVVVIAKAEEDYQKWVKEQKAKASQVDLSDREYDWLYAHGEKVYASKCAVCHQANGEGLGQFPALKGSVVATTGPISEHIDIILNGKNVLMPAFKEQLNDVDIAAVVTYERNAWGNDTGQLSQPKDVTSRRQ